jgi:hypothetical protein
MFEISNKKIKTNSVEFCFRNLFNLPIEVYCDLTDDITKPLTFIATLPPSSNTYIYPEINNFKPGVLLFAKLPGDESYLYKPYIMKKFDYFINFGEISSDFLHTDTTLSTRNEILFLYIQNRSLKPYDIYYGGRFVTRVEPFGPHKFELEYTQYTTNFDKHFQLGTYLELRMDLTGTPYQGQEKSQFILIEKKSTTDINVGDVVGRSEIYT